MKLNKSTRYALCAAVELAAAEGGENGQVTVAQVSRRYDIPPAVLAKVFQRLVRAGIAVGSRGTGGGYRLARKASDVTMLDVITNFEPLRPLGRHHLDPSPVTEPSTVDVSPLHRVFDEVDELVRCTFASITLETLVAPRAAHGVDAASRTVPG